MAPTIFLNATCVALETLDYTLINSTTFNQTTCAIDPPTHNNWWNPLRIFGVVLVCLTVTLMVVCFAVHCNSLSTLEFFRSIPSYELHARIEKTYENQLIGRSDKAAFERHEKGRYKSVTYIDNATDGTRTVTLVEDLTKPPLKYTERDDLIKKAKKERKVGRSRPKDLGPFSPSPGRSTTTAQVAPTTSPETQQRDSPVTNLRSLFVDTTQNQSTRDPETPEEMDIGEVPPPYTRH